MADKAKLQKVIGWCAEETKKLIATREEQELKYKRIYDMIASTAEYAQYDGKDFGEFLQSRIDGCDPEKRTFGIYSKAMEIYNS